MTRNTSIPRINSKKFKEVKKLIEKVRIMMIEEFGLDKKVIIDNSINYDGFIYTYGESGKYDYSDITINTRGKTVVRVIETIVHEFTHIEFPDCHSAGKRKMSKEEREQDIKHATKTQRLLKKVLIELGI